MANTEWHENNTNSIYYWQLVDIMWICGIFAVIFITVLYVVSYLQYEIRNFITWIIIMNIWITVVIILIIIAFWDRHRIRNMWCKKIGFSDEEIHFVFYDGSKGEIKWEKIKEIKIITSKYKYITKIFNLPQAILIEKNGKEVMIYICGKVALDTYRRFEEYKKKQEDTLFNSQIQKTMEATHEPKS